MITKSPQHIYGVFLGTADVFIKPSRLGHVKEQFFLLVAAMVDVPSAPGFLHNGQWISVGVEGSTDYDQNKELIASASEELCFNLGRLSALDEFLGNEDRHFANVAINGNEITAIDNEALFDDYVDYYKNDIPDHAAYGKGRAETFKRIKELDIEFLIQLLRSLGYNNEWDEKHLRNLYTEITS